MTTIAIVGGGLSALRSAENLRTRGYTDRILVISDESHLPYNRPPLSKELLWGEADRSTVIFGSSQHTDTIEWMLGRAVTSADLDARTLTLDDGETIAFDGLIAATGVSSRRLPIPGPARGRTVLRTLDDAEAIKEKLTPGAHLVGLGAGFIGCEVARTAIDRGCTVDIVAIDPVPMAVPLGEEIGAEVQRRHADAGIRFHMGRTIAEMLGDDDGITGVRLDDGTELPADLVLETVGSVPNTGWLEGNGLELAGGVLTDERLRAGGRRGIVVVGDIARFPNELFGSDPRRVEHWQTAVDTPVTATATLLHDLGIADEEPAPIGIMPWFWSDQGDLRLTSYGVLAPADSTEVVDGELGGECAVRYIRDGETVGYLLIGMKTKGARYKKQLMKERKALLAASS